MSIDKYETLNQERKIQHTKRERLPHTAVYLRTTKTKQIHLKASSVISDNI